MRSELLQYADQWTTVQFPVQPHTLQCLDCISDYDQQLYGMQDVSFEQIYDHQHPTSSSSNSTNDIGMHYDHHSYPHPAMASQFLMTTCLQQQESISRSGPAAEELFNIYGSTDPPFLDPEAAVNPFPISKKSLGYQECTEADSISQMEIYSPHHAPESSTSTRANPPVLGHSQTSSVNPPQASDKNNTSRLSESDPTNRHLSPPASIPGSFAPLRLPPAGVSPMVSGLESLGAGSHHANCIEKLLVLCAAAVESNDTTMAQQVMWVLNNIASVEGDCNQRVAAYFLNALITRMVRMVPVHLPRASDLYATVKLSNVRFNVTELAGFVDLTPWHRFGFCASNGALMERLEGASRVHILDFSITHCMQWPTLIDALSKRPGGPPLVRLTVHTGVRRPPVPPLLNVSCEEVGARLASFARCKNVPFQFRALSGTIAGIDAGSLGLHAGEELVVNCQMWLRYLPDETAGSLNHQRTRFLRLIRRLRPTIMTIADEDADLIQLTLVDRLRAAFNYLWIPFDALNTFLPHDSQQRLQYESDIGSKIENIIACEGTLRIERLESKDRWLQRLQGAHFQSIPFSDGVVAELKAMLEEHAAGWGLKRDGHALLLTWKGHNVVFATSCITSSMA